MKEQTISNLKKLKSFHNGSFGADIERAIQALEQQPCEDCVSRNDVVKAISDWIIEGEYDYTNATNYLVRRINYLPSVTPQPKTGEWIKERHTIRCDKCNAIVFTSCDYNDREEYREMVMDDYIEQYKYCPECGARMNGGGEE